MTTTGSTNRLAGERSPYLLQHAHNPVDWRPWGEEAFATAVAENKPVFLSIGYSACHWCHVMERESFEDEQTASLLNKNFVSIKVDREERPDVDQIYQLAHQVLAQRGGGWPLSMFLTPDKKPFFGGTYFPNERKYGMPSFRDVLLAIHDAYANKRSDVDAQAAELVAVLLKVTTPSPGSGAAIERRALEDATAQIMRRAERHYGGFGRAPKFPNTMTLDLLLIAAAVGGDEAACDHSCVTLDCMARGGIYDQIGGGFSRYSTDEKWLIPHFEKMLYDNAQLASAYLDGWRTLSDGREASITPERCRTVVAEVFRYVAREMTDATGTFYSAQDADSEGEEGKFFAWIPADIEAVVGAADAPVVCAFYDVTSAGNFEHGKSVLWIPRTIEDVAKAASRTTDDVKRIVASARPKLFDAREKRHKPMRDDKCLVSWNGLMIGALADAGATFAEPDWIASSVKALGTWRSKAWLQGRLRHAIKGTEAYGTAFLDDYAGLAGAALHVYEATFDPHWLAFARELADTAIELFCDDADGGFFYSPSDGEVVLHRTKEIHDHAYPGGVGLMADALLRLATLTGVLRYRATVDRLLGTVAAAARENPMAVGTLVRAMDRAARGAVEIVIVGAADRDDTVALLHAARSVYTPHRSLVCVADEADGARHGVDHGLLHGRTALAGGAPRAFVCRGTVCDAPVTTPAELVATLRRAVRDVASP